MELERLHGFHTFLFSDLMTALTYILMDNFCSCFSMFSIIDVKLKYHPDKGRYLVVEKDVKPGKIKN